MLHFECDYACGAAQPVLDALVRTNGEQTSGYGEDPHCERARALIRQLCRRPDAAVHFVTGGTQANLTVIAAALRPFEGVLCADTGHINVHETGAVEATGHKVLPLPGREGKITAAQVRAAVEAHRDDATHEHMVRPALVYISHPTELGTLYSRQELQDLSDTCRALRIRLFLDGARLGYGLAAQPEVDLPFLARVCDAFTIGDAKVEVTDVTATAATVKLTDKSGTVTNVLGPLTPENTRMLLMSVVDRDRLWTLSKDGKVAVHLNIRQSDKPIADGKVSLVAYNDVVEVNDGSVWPTDTRFLARPET